MENGVLARPSRKKDEEVNVGELSFLAQSMLTRYHGVLVLEGYKGDRPDLNLHWEKDLPPVLFQPRTNALAVSARALDTMTANELTDRMLDAMAMCGCHRLYKLQLRDWNSTQNKARMREPSLAMQGTAVWRDIRSKLRSNNGLTR
jgi:hypothetical protein